MNLTRRCFFNGKSSALSDSHQRNGYTDEKREYSCKIIMEELGIKNKTQIEAWGRWYRNGENHRLVQPVGKQYAYGTGPENLSNEQQLRNENNYLKYTLRCLKSTKNWKGRGARNNGEIIAIPSVISKIRLCSGYT